MATIIVANLADLCTFYLVTQIHPIAGEANPVVAPLWAVSPLLVAALKIGGVLVTIAIVGRAHPRIARWGTAVAIAIPVLGMVVNTAAGMV